MTRLLALALLLWALPATAAEGWSAIDGDTVRTPAGERVRIMLIRFEHAAPKG
jgi:hypothetical protein